MRYAECGMRSEKTGLRIQKGGKKDRIQESYQMRNAEWGRVNESVGGSCYKGLPFLCHIHASSISNNRQSLRFFWLNLP